MQLAPDLIYGPKPLISLKNTKNSGSSARNKRRKDQSLMNAFQDLFRIGQDVFEVLVADDLVLIRPSKTKKRVYIEGKIPLGQYRLGWGPWKRKGRKKFQRVG